MKKVDEDELISLIQKGNIRAFDEFYKRNWQPLYQIAYRSTLSVDDSKDLVQNVFINFWNTRESLDLERFHISYLFTSLRNGIKNQYKKQQYVANMPKGSFKNNPFIQTKIITLRKSLPKPYKKG